MDSRSRTDSGLDLESTPGFSLTDMRETQSSSIADVAELTGLSQDTLRWYEREGILPRVGRSASGHRRYSERERDLVLMLAALRDTGMTTEMMKEFVALLGEGAASHGRRVALLERARERLAAKRAEIERASTALELKIGHYEELIAAGLDCDGAPVAEEVRTLQTARE
ncbi:MULTISPECIES: MerR family transcriptional regulator [Brevibacterium]|uniref:MerR family transcriptional regulator n=1 Tax=Brevibacterium ammoniilyticum TaxID=1046555 RepID=A0ABP9U6T3_9MICO